MCVWHLEGNEKRDRLDAVVPPVHVVPHEKIVGRRNVTADSEQLHQVVELPVDIAAHRHLIQSSCKREVRGKERSAGVEMYKRLRSAEVEMSRGGDVQRWRCASLLRHTLMSKSSQLKHISTRSTCGTQVTRKLHGGSGRTRFMIFSRQRLRLMFVMGHNNSDKSEKTHRAWHGLHV